MHLCSTLHVCSTKPALKYPQLSIWTGRSSDASPPIPSDTSSLMLREASNNEMRRPGADGGAMRELVDAEQLAIDGTPGMRCTSPAVLRSPNCIRRRFRARG